MSKKLLFTPILMLFCVGMLAACGLEEGETWEAQDYVGVPYTEERTAGRGIKWVRVMMAPLKEVILEPFLPETPLLPREPELPQLKSAETFMEQIIGGKEKGGTYPHPDAKGHTQMKTEVITTHIHEETAMEEDILVTPSPSDFDQNFSQDEEPIIEDMMEDKGAGIEPNEGTVIFTKENVPPPPSHIKSISTHLSRPRVSKWIPETDIRHATPIFMEKITDP